MKTKRRTSVLSAVLICVMLLVCSVSVSRGAERTGSIEMVYELSDVPFSLYRVALITDSGVVPTEKFERYHVDLNSENAAQTLAAYIQRDKIPALRSDKTDGSGRVDFEALEKGVYLVIGESTKVEETYYTVMPSLISLPFPHDGVQEWYVRGKVKFEKHTDKLTDISVLKIWKDPAGQITTYPDVKVQLLRGSEVYDTVTLNASNSWKYVWKDLDTRYQWSVTEEEPEIECKVEISRNGYAFVITNAIPDVPETTAPTEPTEPTAPTTPTGPTSPTSPTRPTTPYTPTTPKPTTPVTPYIPQTGQLNWPVPVLSFAGVVLFLTGVLMIRKNRDEK